MAGRTLLLLTPCLVGCGPHAFLNDGMLPWTASKPSQIVLLCAPMQAEANGIAAQPGVLCRAYFFGPNPARPIKVTGSVVFTAYDRSVDGPAHRRPEGEFVVAPEEMEGHYQPDLVGPSYLFWLPFSPKGQTHVLVQATLRPSAGSDISSGVVAVEIGPAVHPLDRKHAQVRGGSVRPRSLAMRPRYTEIDPLPKSSDGDPGIMRDPAVQPAAAAVPLRR